MKDRRRLMIERFCFLGLFGSLIATISAQDEINYTQNEEECDGDAGRGYTTMAALNQDIQTERDRILVGGDPLEMYMFVLCPNTAFGSPLVPALDNIVIGCGESPSSENTCILTGGDVQVEIGSYADTGHPVRMVELIGVTFADFSSAAVAGPEATDATTVVIRDAIFEVRPRRCTILDGTLCYLGVSKSYTYFFF